MPQTSRSGSFLVGLMVGAAIAALGAYLGLDRPEAPPASEAAPPPRLTPKPVPPPPVRRSQLQVPLPELAQVGPMALSPGGRLVAVGGAGGKVLLYDLLMDRPIRAARVHQGEVRDLLFTAQAKSVISGDEHGKVSVLSVPTLKERLVLRPGGAPVRRLALAGASLALAAEQPDLELIPLSGGEPRKLTGHTGSLRAVAATGKGDVLASAGEDTTVRLWRLPGGEPTGTLEGHKLWVNALAFSADGALLASGGFDRAIILWDMATGEKLRTLSGHGRAVTDLAFTRDRARLASASLDRTARIWAVKDGEPLARLSGHTFQVNRVAWDPQGSRLVSASGDGTLRIAPWPRLVPQNRAPMGPMDPGAVILRRNTSGERAMVRLVDAGGKLTEEGLKALGHMMRSGPDDSVLPPDPELALLLFKVAEHFGREREIRVISGFRSPAYNKLRSRQSKQVGEKSAHMEGKAIDIRIEGVPTTTLRTYLKRQKAGGVGFYADSQFVHMDVMPHRYWEGD